MVVKWLKMVGPENRRLLKDFCLWDWNPKYDRGVPRDLKKVKRSAIFSGMGGSMETLGAPQCCHSITFGDEDEDYVGFVSGMFES